MADAPHDNTEAHNEFMRLVHTPIEPGLCLVLMELERLGKENREHFKILLDWTHDKFGRTVYAAYTMACWPTDDQEGEFFFRVPGEFLKVLGIEVDY